jgi:hypothetical protein
VPSDAVLVFVWSLVVLVSSGVWLMVVYFSQGRAAHGKARTRAEGHRRRAHDEDAEDRATSGRSLRETRNRRPRARRKAPGTGDMHLTWLLRRANGSLFSRRDGSILPFALWPQRDTKCAA